MSKRVFAKTIRTITIPPLLVSTLLVALYFLRPEIYHSASELFAAIVFLAVIPTAAYPLQKLIPKLRDTGREGQRKLAFVMSITGYTAGFIVAMLTDVTNELKFIYGTYLVSVILLIIFNKVLHFRASGHACGVFGPLIHAVYFMGWWWLPPCAIALAAVVWSSLYLTRHTKSELFLGGMSALAGFLFCMII